MSSESPQGAAPGKNGLESFLLRALTGPRRRFWVAFLIFVMVFYICVATASTEWGPGLTWDEAIYLGQAESYLYWGRTIPTGGLGLKDGVLSVKDATEHVPTLSRRGIAAFWQVQKRHDSQVVITPSGDAHPPLGKAIIALFVGLLSHVANLDAILAARAAASFCFAMVCVLLFLFMERRFGLMPGVFSVVMLLLMPRVFGDSHIGSIEMPVLLMWVMTVIAFEKGIGNLRWAALTGVFFGFALLTRVNAAMLMPVLFAWGLIFHRKKAIANVVSMIVISPLVVFAGWPSLWVRTGDVIRGYIFDLTHRFPIPTVYFGSIHFSPGGNGAPAGPWNYPFAMTGFTTPLLILGAAILGAVWSLKKVRKLSKDDTGLGKVPSVFRGLPDKKTVALLLFAALGPLCVMALPGAPKYDGVRLFLVVFPFIAALAGIGAAKSWEWLRGQQGTRLGRRLAPSIMVVMLLWLLVPLIMFYPFELSYYNEFLGGPVGAQKVGMEMTYWGEAFNGDALDAVQNLLPNGGKVAFGAIGEEVADGYRATGRWPDKVATTNFENGDWDLLVVIPRVGWLTNYQQGVWACTNRQQPIWVKYLPFTRVPLCLIYKREGAVSVIPTPVQ